MPPVLSEHFDNCLEILPNNLTNDFFVQLPTSSGCLLFADSADMPIQLLAAANIRRTIKLRLQTDYEAQKAKKIEIKSVTAKVYYTCCYCRFRSDFTCCKIAKKLFAVDYEDYISFGKIWYLKIDLADKWPHFSIAAKPASRGSQKVFAPFITRKFAGQFQDALEDAFGLCKKHGLIGDEQKAKSCPYLQMNSCCGVCIGKISRGEYLKKTEKAIEAVENASVIIDEFTKQMNSFAKNLQFEQAQRLKRQIGRLAVLQRTDFKWITEIHSLQIIHIDKSAKIKVSGKRKKVQTYSAFLIDAGGIKDFGDFVIEDIEKIFGFVQNSRNNKHELPTDKLVENFKLTGYYLYRQNRPGIWLNGRDIHSPGQIEQVINEKFQSRAL